MGDRKFTKNLNNKRTFILIFTIKKNDRVKIKISFTRLFRIQ